MNIEDVRSIVSEIVIPEPLQIRVANHPEGRTFLQIFQEGLCNRTGEVYREGGRKWDISYHATTSEVVFTIWKALLTFQEHELREQFTYKGKRIFDPHISVHALLKACDCTELRG